MDAQTDGLTLSLLELLVAARKTEARYYTIMLVITISYSGQSMYIGQEVMTRLHELPDLVHKGCCKKSSELSNFIISAYLSSKKLISIHFFCEGYENSNG
jgi:hypothetical protein